MPSGNHSTAASKPSNVAKSEIKDESTYNNKTTYLGYQTWFVQDVPPAVSISSLDDPEGVEMPSVHSSADVRSDIQL
jgi:hypothetical protein